MPVLPPITLPPHAGTDAPEGTTAKGGKPGEAGKPAGPPNAQKDVKDDFAAYLARVVAATVSAPAVPQPPPAVSAGPPVAKAGALVTSAKPPSPLPLPALAPGVPGESRPLSLPGTAPAVQPPVSGLPGVPTVPTGKPGAGKETIPGTPTDSPTGQTEKPAAAQLPSAGLPAASLPEAVPPTAEATVPPDPTVNQQPATATAVPTPVPEPPRLPPVAAGPVSAAVEVASLPVPLDSPPPKSTSAPATDSPPGNGQLPASERDASSTQGPPAGNPLAAHAAATMAPGPAPGAPAPAASSLPAAAQLAQAFVTRAALVVRDGRTDFHLSLEPPHLGTVHVYLTATDQTITARVVVSHEGTQTLLTNQAQELRQTLAQAGIALGGFDVSRDGGRGSEGWRPPAPEPPAPAWQSGPAPPRAPALTATADVPDGINLLA